MARQPATSICSSSGLSCGALTRLFGARAADDRRRRHPRGRRRRGARGRDRDLEPGRLAGGDVRERNAHRRALARRRRHGATAVDVRVGARSRRPRSRTAHVEQEMGAVTWSAPSGSPDLEVDRRSSVGNPHAVVVGDPTQTCRHRPAARDTSALSRTARTSRSFGSTAPSVHRAGVGARRGGDAVVGDERRRRRRARPTATATVARPLPRR